MVICTLRRHFATPSLALEKKSKQPTTLQYAARSFATQSDQISLPEARDLGGGMHNFELTKIATPKGGE